MRGISQWPTELERAQKRYDQARARLQALRNREAARERKLDTRRKVILGGALMDLATHDAGAAALLNRLVRSLPRDQDRKTFDGWSPETRADDEAIGAMSPPDPDGALRPDNPGQDP